MDKTGENDLERIKTFLTSEIGKAHSHLPDFEEFFGQGTEYTDDGEGDVREKTAEEHQGDVDEFRIHALRQAIIVGEPHYQFLVGLVLLGEEWGLSAKTLIQRAAKAGIEPARQTLEKLSNVSPKR